MHFRWFSHQTAVSLILVFELLALRNKFFVHFCLGKRSNSGDGPHSCSRIESGRECAFWRRRVESGVGQVRGGYTARRPERSSLCKSCSLRNPLGTVSAEIVADLLVNAHRGSSVVSLKLRLMHKRLARSFTLYMERR